MNVINWELAIKFATINQVDMNVIAIQATDLLFQQKIWTNLSRINVVLGDQILCYFCLIVQQFGNMTLLPTNIIH